MFPFFVSAHYGGSDVSKGIHEFPGPWITVVEGLSNLQRPVLVFWNGPARLEITRDYKTKID